MPVTMSLPCPAGSQINAQSLVRSSVTMEIVEK
jgi:hypothetical protein